jgi:hypothetical protein
VKLFNALALGTGALIFLVGVSVPLSVALGAQVTEGQVGTGFALVIIGGVIVLGFKEDEK